MYQLAQVSTLAQFTISHGDYSMIRVQLIICRTLLINLHKELLIAAYVLRQKLICKARRTIIIGDCTEDECLSVFASH